MSHFCNNSLILFTEDLRKLVLEKEQLDSEVLGLRAELQQLQTLSENQKSEIQSLQLLVSGMSSFSYTYINMDEPNILKTFMFCT